MRTHGSIPFTPFDRLTHRHERAGRRCRSGNTYLESATLTLGCRREVEEVLSVLVNAIGRPHRIRIGAYPRHIVLSYYHAVVGPVDKIVGGEYMIIGHAEPFLEALDGAGNVVRWIKIHFSIKTRAVGSAVNWSRTMGFWAVANIEANPNAPVEMIVKNRWFMVTLKITII